MMSLERAAAAGLFCCLAFAQQVSTTPRFDAASVHRSASIANPQTYRSGGFLRGSRYDLRKATMLDLIRLPYGFDPNTVVGGPDWLEIDRFDIAAKAPPSTPKQQIALMLQSLLTERFHLVFHQDSRPMPAFVLRQNREKPKLKQSAGWENPECQYRQQPEGSTYTRYTCRNITMADFARQLHGMAGDYLADPVTDATGLTGAWDFDLEWNSRSRILPPGAPRTTIFNAVEQQLGLKLASDKVPATVIFIDSVNEQPAPDAPNVAQLLPSREVQFEVASVKPSKPGEQGGGLKVPPDVFEWKSETMRNLFATAWDIHWDHYDELISGAPKWMDSARFDILAKIGAVANGSAPPGASFIDDDIRLMLRNLLIERFKIKTHYEQRPESAYTLVAAKPRLKKADPANRPNCKEAHTVENDPRDLNPRLSRLLQCQNVTMAQFAEELMPLSANDFAYGVVDGTGIGGRWDLLLSFTPTGDRRNPAGTLFFEGTSPSDPSGAISIFEAINKQLGLRLEKRKRILPVLVIDHIEEKPADN